MPPDGAPSPRGAVLRRARFDPKLRHYLFFQSMALLFATVVGVVAIPVWLFMGPWWAKRYLRHLECALTERALVHRKGIAFRSETTVPLDKIQDVSVRYGPVLDWLGIAKLTVVTAGQHGGQGGAVSLVGVVDPVDFRDAVLRQRDRVVASAQNHALPASEGPTDPGGPGGRDQVVALLAEIRDSLRSIDHRLGGDAPQR